MEIRITTEQLARILWVASAAFTVIGFLLTLYGLIVALTLNEGARVQAAIFPVAITAAGVGLAVIPWCLASSVSRLIEIVDRTGDPGAAGDGSSD